MLQFQDSFDDRNTATGGILYGKYDDWRVVNGSPFVPDSVSGVTGFTNRGANFGVGAFGFNYLTKNLTARATMIFAYRFRMATSPASFERLLEFKNSTTVHLYVRRNTGAAGTLSVYRGDDTLIATSTDTVDYNIVAHLQFKATIDNSVGSFELRVNGINILSRTGIDTQNGGSAVVDNITFGSLTGSYAVQCDDVVICDTTGSYNNSFPGNQKIVCLSASAVGTSSMFTRSGGSAAGNYTAINESNYDDDTSYVYSPNVSDTDLYNFQNINDSTITVKAITAYIRARKDDSLTRNIAPVIRSNSSNVPGSDLTLTTSYQNFWGLLYETNPTTGLPWTVAEINAMELGVRVTQ